MIYNHVTVDIAVPLLYVCLYPCLDLYLLMFLWRTLTNIVTIHVPWPQERIVYGGVEIYLNWEWGCWREVLKLCLETYIRLYSGCKRMSLVLTWMAACTRKKRTTAQARRIINSCLAGKFNVHEKQVMGWR